MKHETWMRERERQAETGRRREAALIAEAESEAQRRRIARMETELALLEKLKTPLRRVK